MVLLGIYMAKKKVKAKTTGTSKKKKDHFFRGYEAYVPFIGIGIIFLLGILIYANSFAGAFHFDDLNNIVDNKKLRDFTDVEGIWRMSQRRFLAYYSFALNYHYGELNVWGYHLVNLFIHLMNACLVGWMTLLLFKTPSLKANSLAKHSLAISFCAALLFVSHPLATQSVTYIVQRMASMVSMFYLLTMVFYIKTRLVENNKGQQFLFVTLAVLSALMAMMTKENAFTIPFAIVLLEVCFLQTRSFKVDFKDYRVHLVIGAFLLTVAIVLMNFSLSIFNPIPPGIDHPYVLTPMNYFITQFSVIAKYIQLLILPINLNVDYDYRVVENFFEIKTVLSFLFLGGLLSAAVLLFKKHKLFSFGVFWFFLTLAIESSFVPIADVIFEHRTYLPSVGFFIIVSAYVFHFLWDKHKPIGIALLVLIIGINSFLTYQRNKVWKDEVSLLEDVISKSPNKARPYVNLGAVYMDRGEWDLAATNFSKGISVNPNYLDAYNNRGAAYTNLNKLELAISDYSKAIEINPKYVGAYYNRGITYANLRQWDNAIADYSAAIEFSPNNAQLFFNRGNAYMQLQALDQAIKEYTQAIALDPNYVSAYNNRGIVYGRLNQLPNAITDFTSALSLQPNAYNILEQRALALANSGQWATAINDFSRMIEINAQNPNVLYNRGYSYENLGQWQSALTDYDRALSINPNHTKAQAGRNYVIAKIRLGN